MPTFSNATSQSEDQVINIIRTNVESQFPKSCTACGRLFNSLKEYLENTVHLGQPHSYNAELKDWQPRNPMGTFSFSKCNCCGNTMALGSSSMKVVTMWKLLRWAKKEKAQRGVSIKELLNDIREKIDNQVLAEKMSCFESF